MKTAQPKLALEQMDKKLQAMGVLKSAAMPANGWVNALRTALGMSLRQLAERLDITSQSAKEIELREKEASITLKSLREAGQAMGLQLVYGFVPLEGSLEAMIEERARKKAKEIVMRTSHSMALENQENSKERLAKAIEQKAAELKASTPRYLWD